MHEISMKIMLRSHKSITYTYTILRSNKMLSVCNIFCVFVCEIAQKSRFWYEINMIINQNELGFVEWMDCFLLRPDESWELQLFKYYSVVSGSCSVSITHVKFVFPSHGCETLSIFRFWLQSKWLKSCCKNQVTHLHVMAI